MSQTNTHPEMYLMLVIHRAQEFKEQYLNKIMGT